MSDRRGLPGLRVELEPELALATFGKSPAEMEYMARVFYRWSKQIWCYLSICHPEFEIRCQKRPGAKRGGGRPQTRNRSGDDPKLGL